MGIRENTKSFAVRRLSTSVQKCFLQLICDIVFSCEEMPKQKCSPRSKLGLITLSIK